MNIIDFVTTWFWYFMAFAAGALVAWLVVRQLVPARTPQEAIDRAIDRHNRPDEGSDRHDHGDLGDGDDAHDTGRPNGRRPLVKETYR